MTTSIIVLYLSHIANNSFASLLHINWSQSLSANRLNQNRVDSLRSDNPEKSKMTDLVLGMKVHLRSNFQANGANGKALTPLRNSYVRFHHAVNKMLGDTLDQQLAFILPAHLARQYVPRWHLCKSHWTQKKGKKSGRPLGDLTYVDGCALNTPETAVADINVAAGTHIPGEDNLCRRGANQMLRSKSKQLVWESMAPTRTNLSEKS